MKRVYKVNEWDALKTQIQAWKDKGDDLVFTNGCFDLLHDGHRALLGFARHQGGKVIVGLNTDDSVRRIKGRGRPINPAKSRSRALLDTGFVDAVVFFDENTPQRILDHIEPDILIKGSDYDLKTTVGAPEVASRGGKVLFFEKLPGVSTTTLLEHSGKNIETNDK